MTHLLTGSPSCLPRPLLSIPHTPRNTRAVLPTPRRASLRHTSRCTQRSPREAIGSGLRPDVVLGTAHRVGRSRFLPVSAISPSLVSDAYNYSILLDMLTTSAMVRPPSILSPRTPMCMHNTHLISKQVRFFESVRTRRRPPLHKFTPTPHQGRITWMTSLATQLGGPSKAQDMLKAKGISLILKSITVNFKRPVTYPDTVRPTPTPFTPHSSHPTSSPLRGTDSS